MYNKTQLFFFKKKKKDLKCVHIKQTKQQNDEDISLESKPFISDRRPHGPHSVYPIALGV